MCISPRRGIKNDIFTLDVCGLSAPCRYASSYDLAGYGTSRAKRCAEPQNNPSSLPPLITQLFDLPPGAAALSRHPERNLYRLVIPTDSGRRNP